MNNSSSFNYKAGLLGNTTELAANADGNNYPAGRKIEVAKIFVPLKYLSNFFRALEMLLINCKVHLDLTWTKDCPLSTIDGNTKFQITDTKFYIPVVILSAKDNANFIKQQNDGFKRSVYWN